MWAFLTIAAILAALYLVRSSATRRARERAKARQRDEVIRAMQERLIMDGEMLCAMKSMLHSAHTSVQHAPPNQQWRR